MPRKAAVWWYFRDSTAEGAGKLFEQAKKIAEGAAMMSNTEVEVDMMSAVWPVRGNRTAGGDGAARNRGRRHAEMERGGGRAGAQRAGASRTCRSTGLRARIRADEGPAVQKAAANDAGDVSWKVPMVKFYYPANIPNISFHHWAAGVALATSIAHKGAVAGAKVIAASVVECFSNPAVVDEAKRTFKEELGGIEYDRCCRPIRSRR